MTQSNSIDEHEFIVATSNVQDADFLNSDEEHIGYEMLNQDFGQNNVYPLEENNIICNRDFDINSTHIMDIMKNIILPDKNIPEWTNIILEVDWKSKLDDMLND